MVAFTASQLPNISNRKYPSELAGDLYPKGIPIFPENELPKLIKRFDVDEVMLAYSDLSYKKVMEKASFVLSNGPDFSLLGPKSTMLESNKPVIAVTATRTGAGKSTVSRKISKILRKKGHKVGIVRHPMPYGDLKKQIWQRFEKYEDLIKENCSIEEQEEYMQHIRNDFVVFSGVDYKKILNKVEKEFGVILWDGGNNDLSFFKPDLHIVVTDPLRAGSEVNSYPGEINARMADLVIINKTKIADPKNIKMIEENISKINPKATILKASSKISVENKHLIKGKRVLCLEDGPTVTHGDLPHSVAYKAAQKFEAKKIIDPRPYAVGSLKKVYEEYPHMGKVLPAIGYGKKQVQELEKTINKTECDLIILGTPAPLEKVMKLNKPHVRVGFELSIGNKLKKAIEKTKLFKK